MTIHWSKRTIRALTLAASVSFPCLLGCGKNGPATYPVQGVVELTGAEVQHLAGGHVEIALVSDPAVRASGAIQADGRFQLETIRAGNILPGAQAGEYRVRIILTEEDSKSRRQAAQAVAPRFLDFKTSGLTLEVPVGSDVVIALARP
jgi:hypothetical protein